MTRINFEKNTTNRPIIIAGPCMAEAPDTMRRVAEHLKKLAEELGFTYVFKSSFDKANRTSINSDRGPGLIKAGEWIASIAREFTVPTLTDVHETAQVEAAAEFADILQIPAFLCRQTDLLVAAVKTGKAVNVKKGQFLAPEATAHIVAKTREAAEEGGVEVNIALTERGASFGYGDLVVDMRALKIMAETGVPVIFDITHSCQKPASGAGTSTSGGARSFAPLLARSAVASGYVDGLFLEVHPDPQNAKSDAMVQLSLSQAELLLRQIVPLLKKANNFNEIDESFTN